MSFAERMHHLADAVIKGVEEGGDGLEDGGEEVGGQGVERWEQGAGCDSAESSSRREEEDPAIRAVERAALYSFCSVQKEKNKRPAKK